MQLDSTKVIINASKKEVKTFLSDSNNLIHLLPQNAISEFQSSKKECSFKVQKGIFISLAQDGMDNENIFLKSGEKSPFPFKLKIKLKEKDLSTQAYINFNGEINSFLKMLLEKPLSNLFDFMSKKLQDHFAK